MTIIARLTGGVMLLAAVAANTPAGADDAPKSHLTGDWGGFRSRVEQAGIDPEFNYTSEVAYNARGGTDDLVRYTDQLTFSSAFDLDRLTGLHDAEFKLAITKRNGRNLSDDAHLGTLQQVQEVYGRGQAWRLTQFWFDQKYFAKRLDWKIGRLPVGDDFADFSCKFQNLTFCGSQPGNIVGNYWFNWPVSQWATRVKVNVLEDLAVQAGAYEINPRFLERRDAMLPTFPSGATGVMFPVQLTWTPQFGADKLKGSYEIGAWYDTSSADDVFDDVNDDPAALSGLSPKRRTGRYGTYVNLEQQAVRFDRNDASRGLSFFVNATFADRRTSTLDNQIAVGLISTGTFDLRPKDEIGLAVGRTHVNGRVAHGEHLSGDVVQHSEYAAELYYGLQAYDGVMLRPNVQYIKDPGGASRNKDVVVIGLKTSVDF
jgi:porin